MKFRDFYNSHKQYLKTAAYVCGSGLFIAYHVNMTYKHINKIVNHRVLEREKKFISEYIYIDDPSYNALIEKERASHQPIGIMRIWKSLKHSMAWRLLWMCKHGNRDQVNIGLQRLAAFKNDKDWDYLKLAQAIDAKTAVLLARTRGADLRYFLPPPLHVRKAAISPDLLSFKLRDMILQIHMMNPHGCIEHFLNKYFAHEHHEEHTIEADSIPAKPNPANERSLCILCLDAIYHHLNIFQRQTYQEDLSIRKLINMGLLTSIAELTLRYENDVEVESAMLRILTLLSVHKNLLTDFFENGLIRVLSRLLRYNDVKLSSSAAVCLANLSGEHSFRPGLYLLHPIYRTKQIPACDIMLVHGLRGGVFVTWRQRDQSCKRPVGVINATVSDVDSHPVPDGSEDTINYMTDPDFHQAIEDLMEFDEQLLLSDLEVVLEDVPINVKRENVKPKSYLAKKKRLALQQELEDKKNHTQCWPKDWLPHDFGNLRVLGVNYETSLSEWLERCTVQSINIATRAELLEPALKDAGIGRRPVVWLTHSMGGLIVKQVLVNASQESTSFHQKLCENTKAILFYSTPHKGSPVITMSKAAILLWLSNDVKQLQENSPELLKLQDKFLNIADLYNWDTICFAETRPTLISALKVPFLFVSPVSADLGRGVFYEMYLDHLSICKPATRQSLLYTVVLEAIFRATVGTDHLHLQIHPWLEWVYKLFKIVMNEYKEKLDGSPPSNERWIEQKIVDLIVKGFGD